MLLPVVGAYVLHARSGEVGTVTGHEGGRLTVTWGDGRSARVARQDVRCGLPVGQAVQEHHGAPRRCRCTKWLGLCA